MISPLVRKGAAPFLTLAFLSGAAYLQALAVARFVAPALLPSPKGLAEALARPSARPIEAPGRPAGEHQTSAERLLQRNPFDSERGNLLPPAPPPEGAPAAGPGAGDPHAAPACDGVRVLATAAAKEAGDSFALLAGGGAPNAAPAGVVRRQGDDFQGKRVWFITWDRVWLSGPGSFCQAALFSSPPPAERAGKGPQAPPRAAGEPLRVRPVGPGSYEIERSVVEGLIEKQGELLRTVRAKPELAGGRVVGLRVQSIQPGSPLAQIGIEAGDRLETLNGVDMADPGGLLEAYARLRLADRLRVTLTRAGRPTTLEYAIK
ncbi:MAG TPA: type II secretion system protein GspC [Polyangiaceae bacterium]|nr:type II secretion system protein GspC [Polyangiaceae bacterium]